MKELTKTRKASSKFHLDPSYGVLEKKSVQEYYKTDPKENLLFPAFLTF
jgi:hypothetical protein